MNKVSGCGLYRVILQTFYNNLIFNIIIILKCVYNTYKTYTILMDWLSDLGKNQPIVCVDKKKNRNKSYTKKALDIKEYKANYYIKNIEVYNERNRLASLKRTEERLAKISDDETIYKLKVILEN